MNLYGLSKKLTVARQNGFVFNRINKLVLEKYSHQRYINISYYLESQIPRCHRQCFRVFSQHRENVELFRNDMENFFEFACQKWFNQLN